MDIRTRLLDIGPHTRSGQPLPIINGLVVHWLGNAGVGAEAHANYFDSFAKTGPRYASYHFIIDVDGSIMQLIPYGEVAWHAGPSTKVYETTKLLLGGLPNWRTLGISMAHPDWSGKPTPETYLALVRLVTHLCLRFSIPASRVLRHHDCTGKICPRYYVDNPDMWDAFLSQIRMALHGHQK